MFAPHSSLNDAAVSGIQGGTVQLRDLSSNISEPQKLTKDGVWRELVVS